MAPPEPPRSIYGTLPRTAGNLVRASSDNSLPLSSHYATFRKEKLGPKVSLKLKQMLKDGGHDDKVSIMSGTESSGAGSKNRKQISESVYQHVPVKAPAPLPPQKNVAEKVSEKLVSIFCNYCISCITCMLIIYWHLTIISMLLSHSCMVLFFSPNCRIVQFKFPHRTFESVVKSLVSDNFHF